MSVEGSIRDNNIANTAQILFETSMIVDRGIIIEFCLW
jgi:hypothetical protein